MDKLQLRYQITMHTLLIFILAVFFNGLIKQLYVWAQPMAESLLLLFIPATYFITAAIVKDAYFSDKTRRPPFLFPMLAAGGLSLLLFLYGIYSGDFHIFESGKLSNSSCIVITTLFLLYVPLLSLVHTFRKK